MNRLEYVQKLSIELDSLGVTIEEKNEILEDFGSHFVDGAEQGLTEAQICEKLGDVSEIAKQYVGETESPQTTTATAYNQCSNSKFNSKFNFNMGGLIGIIFMDVFVFSWAIPTLLSLIAAYAAIVISFTISGFVILFAPLFVPSMIFTSLSFISSLFLAIMFLSLGGLGVIGGFYVFKFFIWCMKWFINLHTMWVAGKRVFYKQKEESYD